MSLLLAIVAAILLGTADFCAARAGRNAPSISVTRTAVLTSVCLAPLLLLVKPVTWTWRDVLFGLCAGIFMTTSLAALYHGYSIAPIGVVGPISSVLIALVPLAYDVVEEGFRPGVWAWVGIVLGLAALGLTSYSKGGQGSVGKGALLGFLAGCGFGVAFILVSKPATSAGLMPVLMQRSSGFAILAALQPRDRQPLVLTASSAERMWSMLSGAAAVCAIGSLALAFQEGSTGPVSVAASQFASVAVILAAIFLKERLKWWQTFGVVCSAVGVALMSAG